MPEVPFSIPAHAGNISSGPRNRAHGISIPAHAGNIAPFHRWRQGALFQFPHTRETFAAKPVGLSPDNFNSRTRGKHLYCGRNFRHCGFNSRTRGKHPSFWHMYRMLFFQFPHTRETWLTSIERVSRLTFNSRTRGKHCLWHRSLRRHCLSIPAHAGNIVAWLIASGWTIFQFPHTRETFVGSFSD